MLGFCRTSVVALSQTCTAKVKTTFMQCRMRGQQEPSLPADPKKRTFHQNGFTEGVVLGSYASGSKLYFASQLLGGKNPESVLGIHIRMTRVQPHFHLIFFFFSFSEMRCKSCRPCLLEQNTHGFLFPAKVTRAHTYLRMRGEPCGELYGE